MYDFAIDMLLSILYSSRHRYVVFWQDFWLLFWFLEPFILRLSWGVLRQDFWLLFWYLSHSIWVIRNYFWPRLQAFIFVYRALTLGRFRDFILVLIASYYRRPRLQFIWTRGSVCSAALAYELVAQCAPQPSHMVSWLSLLCSLRIWTRGSVCPAAFAYRLVAQSALQPSDMHSWLSLLRNLRIWTRGSICAAAFAYALVAQSALQPSHMDSWLSLLRSLRIWIRGSVCSAAFAYGLVAQSAPQPSHMDTRLSLLRSLRKWIRSSVCSAAFAYVRIVFQYLKHPTLFRLYKIVLDKQFSISYGYYPLNLLPAEYKCERLIFLPSPRPQIRCSKRNRKII